MTLIQLNCSQTLIPWYRIALGCVVSCLNKLTVNTSKTNYVLFTKHKHSFDVSDVILGNTVLTHVSVTKFLGVEVDDKLLWKYHICSPFGCEKLSQYTGILSKIIYKVNSDTALLLYNIMFQLHIHYCNLIWADRYKSALLPIIVLQK